MLNLDNRWVNSVVIEMLERRRLLTSASVSSSHVLSITGTSGNDTIVVNKLSNGKYSVTNVASHFTQGSGSGQFTNISINAAGGADKVTINTNVKYTRATILGGDGNDTLTGGNGADSIDGQLGMDQLQGGSGNDTLVGADGAKDTLDGGSGTNVSDSEPGDVHKNIGKVQAVNLAVEVDGTVYEVNGTSGNDSMSASIDKNDVLNVTINGVSFSYSAAERIAVMKAQVPNDATDNFDQDRVAILGGGGNDTINAGTGIEDVVGGDGNDQLTVTDVVEVIGGPGNDKITDNPSSAQHAGQFIYGDSTSGHTPPNEFDNGNPAPGNDTIIGSKYSDQIFGGGGTDSIKPGKSTQNNAQVFGDPLDGDQIVLEGNNRSTIDLSDRTDALVGSLQYDSTAKVVTGFVQGTSGNTFIQVNGSTSPIIIGGSGADSLTGSSLGDSLNGGGGNDTLSGGAGDDTMDGGSGADVMSGSAGNDTVTYASRTKSVNVSLDNVANDGESGEHDNVKADVDTVIGGSGNDTISGNPFNQKFIGNGGNDTLFGSVGNDTLEGDSGNDQLFGQDGDDLLLAKDGQKDSLDGGNGTDTAQRDNSSSVKDVITNVEAFM